MNVPNNQDYKKEIVQFCRAMVFSKEIIIGNHVIITAKIDVGSGRVNGTMGKVIDIEKNVPMNTPIYG